MTEHGLDWDLVKASAAHWWSAHHAMVQGVVGKAVAAVIVFGFMWVIVTSGKKN